MLTIGVVQPSSERGGIEIGLLNWLRHLDRREFRCVVYLPGEGPIIPLYEAEQIEVRVLPMRQLRASLALNNQAAYIGGFLPTAYRLGRQLVRDGVDVVHSNSLYSLYGAVSARLAGLPLVWHIHEIPEQSRALVVGLTEVVARSSRQVVCISPPVTRIFRPRWRLSGRVVEITEGIDLERFQDGANGDQVRQDLHLGPADVLITWAARLDPWKGAEVFVKAAAKASRENPNLRFLMCGGELRGYEPYARQIAALVDSLGMGDRITLAGWRYGWMDMPGVMAATDVLVHTPVAPEPLGMVILEAMGAGRPVVASNDGGPATIIDDGRTGYLVPPRDSQGFSERILRLAGDAGLRATLGAAGRRRAEQKYDSRVYAKAMGAMFRGIVTA